MTKQIRDFSSTVFCGIALALFAATASFPLGAQETKDEPEQETKAPPPAPKPEPAPAMTPLSPIRPGLEFLEGIPLKEDQKAKILKIHDEATRNFSALQNGSEPEDRDAPRPRGRLRRIRQIQRETFASIREHLTPEQRERILKRSRELSSGSAAPPSGKHEAPFDLFADPLFIELLRTDPAAKTEAPDDWRRPFEMPQDVEATTAPNVLDKPTLDLLALRNIEAAPLCSDAVFLRRAFLDLIGTVPTVKETTGFLHDTRPDKRSRLIDALLERPEFVEYWTLKWSDTLRVKAEFPINLWPNGAMTYHRWIRESVRVDKPLDRFARELLLGSGSNFRDPPSNFYRAVQNRDAASIAESVALTMLGCRFESLTPEKRNELAAFFSRVAYKGSAEWKEEIVYWDDTPLDRPEVVFPDGRKGRVDPDRDPRSVFADWLFAADNPRFARATANRIWYWIFGIGVVQEPDDFRDDNPPSNPALLDLLADELVRSKYDMKQLLRLILNSRTYQRSSIARSDDPAAERLFAFYPTRRIEAEVLQDMFRSIFGVNIGFASDVPEPYTNIPAWRRTIMLPDGSITSPFLETFGRPTRDSGLESDRNVQATASQRMFLVNSSEMMQWIEQSRRLRRAAVTASNRGKAPERRRLMLRYIWLAVLNRYPTDLEVEKAAARFSQKGRNDDAAHQDLVWALVNSKEFLCRH